jgi:hypothetical protein
MDKPIREGIEACRPASDDLQSPDMTDVARAVQDDPEARLAYERVQQWDAAMAQSMDQVGVPAGLAERILARLRSAAGETSLLAGAVAPASDNGEATLEVRVATAPTRAGWSRRHWVGAAVSGIVAAALVIAVGYWLQPDSDLPFDLLADQWAGQLSNDWQQAARAPRDFAPPATVLVSPGRWQWIDRFTTVPVVAYELVHHKERAMLYVAKTTRPNLPGAPPQRPQSNTGGRAIAWWQSGSHVYVLVVDDERSYRAFVQPSTTPFA